MQNLENEFIVQLTNWQNPLLSYLVRILGNLHDARDVLQATNMALWEKKDEFKVGSDFGPWARKFAYFQALAFTRDRKRDRHVFDVELMEKLAHDKVELGNEVEREMALRHCLSQLPKHQRELIECRYSAEGSFQAAVQHTGKKESTVGVALMRIRRSLRACIETKLEAQGL